MIIIGLGNPGKKFELTRHNAGFFVLDKIRASWDFPEFKFEKKFNAEISQGKISLSSSPVIGRGCPDVFVGTGEGNDDKIILVKPQTYMNLSGDSTKAILDFYKLDPENIIVIHDDIDIPLGKFKIAVDSSSAGHNGVQNIIENLGTQKFKRVRIGVGKTEEEKESCPISAHDFVLGKFSAEELETLEKLYPRILEETKKLL